MNRIDINETGRQMIKSFLESNHKQFQNGIDGHMLDAWCFDAIDHMFDEGDLPHIELKSWDCVWGHAKIFEVPIEGVELP